MSILIVEDNDITAEIIGFNLRQQNYQTIVARDGMEAIQALEANPGLQLVITDLNLPKLSGLDLIRLMKESPAWKCIPVMVCSSHADTEHVMSAARLGCRHYLLKPVQRAALLRKVTEILGQQQAALGDRSQIMQQYGLDEQSYREVLEKFDRLVRTQINCLEAQPASLSSAAATLDREGLTEAANLLGANRLLAVLRRLPADAVNPPVGGSAGDALLNELKAVAAAAQAALQSPT